MTELELRNKVVSVMKGWLGTKQGDAMHEAILDIYNTHHPLARNYKVKLTDAWCATTVSAAFIKANLADLIGTECGCGEMVTKAQKMGIWCENDAYTPTVGDIIMYDWNDTGKGDCTGWPDHVGIVEKVEGKRMTIIEGNLNKSVARRSIEVDAKTIRGYILPKYSTKAEKEPVKVYGVATTALYLRQGPSKTYGLCGIDRRDGRGYRYNLYQNEKVEIAGQDAKSGWYKLRIECGPDVLWPYASNNFIKKV